MKRLAMFALVLSAAFSSGAIDLSFSFTGGTNGTALTTNLMLLATHGDTNHNWVSDPGPLTTNIYLSTNSLFTFPNGYICSNNSWGGGMSARFDFTQESFWDWGFTTEESNICGFFFFMTDAPLGAYGVNNGIDIFTIQSWDGGYGIIQYYQYADHAILHPHDGETSTLNVTNNIPYYVTWVWMINHGFLAKIYNATNFSYVGMISNMTSVLSHGAVITSFGINTHGFTPTNHLWYGDWAFAFNTNAWPILPNTNILTATTNIIPDDRRITWQGNVGVQGGITNLTTIWTNVSGIDNTGATDVSYPLQYCLDNCPANQVIHIPAGTYKVNSNLVLKGSYVVRGDGPSTVISGNGSGNFGIFGFGTFNDTSFGGVYLKSGVPTATANITSGGTKGSTSLVVSSATGITNGMLMCIDETNNFALVTPCGSENLNGAAGVNDCASRSNNTRLVGQVVVITNISGTTIQFDPPLFWDFTNAPQEQCVPCYLRYAGVENLKVYANNTGYSCNFSMCGAADCWIKNVECDYADGNQVWAKTCVRCEIRDSYFHDGFLHTAGTTDDCILIGGHSTGMLVENNILRRLHISVMVEHGGGGNVVAYNFSTNNFDSGSTNTVFSDFDYHGAHVAQVLWEGNVGSIFNQDGGWGSASHGTAFRNFLSGENWCCPPYTGGRSAEQTNSYVHQFQALRVFNLAYNSRYFNAIGNILGDNNINPNYLNGISGSSYPGHTQAAWPAAPLNYDDAYAYSLGYGGGGDSGFDPVASPNDGVLQSTTLLSHGNWDSVSRAQTWNAGITNHTLPSSLYLAAKPSWWGSLTYPPFDPSNTNSMTNMIPAELRYFVPPPPGSGAPHIVALTVNGRLLKFR